MKYGELFKFNPLTPVIQLKNACAIADARSNVKDYVISPEMSVRLVAAAENLQFLTPHAAQGMFVVGNYGSGKSHLMSVLTAVAEHAELLDDVSDANFKSSAKSIAGKFKVIRTELTTTMTLRDAITKIISDGLAEMGIGYVFPNQNEVVDDKKSYLAMMKKFNEKFPEFGLIIAVDELLEYLEQHNSQELSADLSALRVLGEVSMDTRFRFIAGVQESLFTKPSLQFASAALARVQARYSQLAIVSSDIKYVVANRLLKKTAMQRKAIRDHLDKFSKFYGNMASRMDEFVDMFPVHPDYVETVDRLTVVEKRETLKTISGQMGELKDCEVNPDDPGLFAFDGFWDILSKPVYLSNEDVRKVHECGVKLIDHINHNYDKKCNREAALRIVKALGVHRLTIGDIRKPVGLGAVALRDELLVYDPKVAMLGGSDPAEDMRGFVEDCARKVREAANGQFLSVSDTTGQYYYDVEKTVDYDQIISQREQTLSDDNLNEAYYAALLEVMEQTDATPYVCGYQVWQYGLLWRDRCVQRRGYLFFGSPNERATAVPEEDYYIYFPGPYGKKSVTAASGADEVMFKCLIAKDEKFLPIIRRYAASLALSYSASGSEKIIYDNKRSEALKQIAALLRKTVNDSFEVSYQGHSASLGKYILDKGLSLRDFSLKVPGETFNFKETIDAMSALCFKDYFQDTAPSYPKFSIFVSRQNIEKTAEEGVRGVVKGGVTSKQGKAVLSALGLLDSSGRVSALGSDSAEYVRSLMKAKGPGKTLNRDELFLPDKKGGNPPLYMDVKNRRLDPEFAMVVLTAMVAGGEISISFAGGVKYNASNVADMSVKDMRDLVNFTHISPMMGWDIASLTALCELLGLAPGLPNLIQANPKADLIAQVQDAAIKHRDALTKAMHKFTVGTSFWGMRLEEMVKFTSSTVERDAAKALMDRVASFDSAGKLRNFRDDPDATLAYKDALAFPDEMEKLVTFADKCDPDANYLAKAGGILPKENPWYAECDHLKTEVFASIQNATPDSLGKSADATAKKLHNVKDTFIAEYTTLHAAARLDARGDKNKNGILSGDGMNALGKLSCIAVLPAADLGAIRDLLGSLKSCPSLTDEDLAAHPLCPHCGYNPAVEPKTNAKSELSRAHGLVETTIEGWKCVLLKNLAEKEIAARLSLLDAGERKIVAQFLKEKEFPNPIDDAFVKAMNNALAGLERVAFRVDDLVNALHEAGPSKPDELISRFGSFIETLVVGKDMDKVRIVVK